jgi:hypothetical protein
MAPAQVALLSNGSSDPPLLHAISLPVQPGSAPILSAVAAPAVYHLSEPECLVPMSGFDQTVGQSAGENLLSASGPTSALSDFPCNKSVVFASSATLLLLMQFLVCCIHRLNPQMRRDVQEKARVRQNQTQIDRENIQPGPRSGSPNKNGDRSRRFFHSQKTLRTCGGALPPNLQAPIP